ncbi:hypothetical protein [Pseudomonas sp. NPDC089406]|uniref:hypothetical protein n=1 Tax=Pseudomonas sp. NPDC089406 TaxID=3364463 RepID=UPI00384EE365
MSEHLEQFVRTLDQALHQARDATARQWPGTRVGSLALELLATVEPGDSAQTLALRLGGTPGRKQASYELSIELPADDGAIVVRVDGQPIGHFTRGGDGQQA